MRKMKLLPLALLLGLSLILTACGSQPSSSTGNQTADQTEPAKETTSVSQENTSSAPEQTTDSSVQEKELESAPSDEPAADHKEVLVVYFSATGTTRGVAERIAKVTDADIYEIVPAEPYTSDDLNWNDKNSRTTHEQNDKSSRPEIAGDKISLEGYTTIYIGFPIWWGEEPRIMDTFVESYDFTGITLIPFCTSGGSGIGRSGPNMEALAGTGTWLEGARHSGNISEADIEAWISGLK